MTPRPSQVTHGSAKLVNNPSPMRFRVISTKPSSEISNTCVRVLSRDKASLKASSTLRRFSRISMSMKSITIIPPISRKRNWRAISSAASRLLWNTVSSRLDLPTFFPVFTSITVSASVCSIMSEPPEGNHTLRSSALRNCSCTRCCSNSGKPSFSASYSSMRSANSGLNAPM